jgi:hypothetical protein
MLCLQCESDQYFTHTFGTRDVGRCVEGDTGSDYPVVSLVVSGEQVRCATAVFEQEETEALARVAVESGDPAYARLLAHYGDALHSYVPAVAAGLRISVYTIAAFLASRDTTVGQLEKQLGRAAVYDLFLRFEPLGRKKSTYFESKLLDQGKYPAFGVSGTGQIAFWLLMNWLVNGGQKIYRPITSSFQEAVSTGTKHHNNNDVNTTMFWARTTDAIKYNKTEMVSNQSKAPVYESFVFPTLRWCAEVFEAHGVFDECGFNIAMISSLGDEAYQEVMAAGEVYVRLHQLVYASTTNSAYSTNDKKELLAFVYDRLKERVPKQEKIIQYPVPDGVAYYSAHTYFRQYDAAKLATTLVMLQAGGVPVSEVERIVDVWLDCVCSLGFVQPSNNEGKVRVLDCVTLLSGVLRLFFADVGDRGGGVAFENISRLPAELMVSLMGVGDLYTRERDRPNKTQEE